MVPGGRSEVSPDLLELIERDFGSLDGLKKEFKQKAEAHVGGGWTWLVGAHMNHSIQGNRNGYKGVRKIEGREKGLC